jgi:prepilin-type processing-associated H-X9-DG protein
MGKLMNEFLTNLGFDVQNLNINPLGDGHINETYLIIINSERFVVQKVQKGLDIRKLEYNYKLYSDACREHEFIFPEWTKISSSSDLNPSGSNESDTYFKYHYQDSNRDIWRIYPFIEGDVLKAPISAEYLYACGEGLDRLHNIMDSIRNAPQAVYPHLHDLNYYYSIYTALLNSGEVSDELRNSDIEKILDSRINEFLNTSLDDISVVHGDTKLGNILFKDGHVTAFIDIDTIMTGSRAEDIADCIRSCSIINGHFDIKAARTFLAGYKKAYENLPYALSKICFELALRYYTDALSKEQVFNEKYPGYHIDRTYELLACNFSDITD